MLVLLALSFACHTAQAAGVLNVDAYQHYIDRFNGMENENVANLIPNAGAWDWIRQNVPSFECPHPDIEEIYWYRWWTYRKHIKQLPDGIGIAEFLTFKTPVSNAVGHHVMEGRWIHDQQYLDQDLLYWLRGTNGKPNDVQKYSSWTTSAYQRFLVNQDKAFITGLLNDFIRDYTEWEQKKLGADGLFWQFDVRDAMEESISGSRKNKNPRPSINSCMYGNAVAIAEVAACPTVAGPDAGDAALVAHAPAVRKRFLLPAEPTSHDCGVRESCALQIRSWLVGQPLRSE